MDMVHLVALRPTRGVYGMVHAGQRFFADPELAEQLERRGVVERYQEPVPVVVLADKIKRVAEAKVVGPPENKAAEAAKRPAARRKPMVKRRRATKTRKTARKK